MYNQKKCLAKSHYHFGFRRDFLKVHAMQPVRKVYYSFLYRLSPGGRGERCPTFTETLCFNFSILKKNIVERYLQ